MLLSEARQAHVGLNFPLCCGCCPADFSKIFASSAVSLKVPESPAKAGRGSAEDEDAVEESHTMQLRRRYASPSTLWAIPW